MFPWLFVKIIRCPVLTVEVYGRLRIFGNAGISYLTNFLFNIVGSKQQFCKFFGDLFTVCFFLGFFGNFVKIIRCPFLPVDVEE
jgi:hypothetical protein